MTINSMRITRKNLVLILAILILIALALPLTARWQGENEAEAAAAVFAEKVWPLGLEGHSPPEVPARVNAAHWAQAGGEAIVLEVDERPFLGELNARPLAEWTSDELGRSAVIVAQNQPALDLLHRTAGLTSSNFDLDYRQGWEMEIPNLRPMLDAGQLLIAETRHHLAENRPQEALRALRSVRSLARACQRESPLIFQLVGLALEKFAWRGIEDFVFAGAADAAVLVELQSPLLETTLEEQFRRGLGTEATLLVSDEGMLYENLGEDEWLKPFVPYLKGQAEAQTLAYYSRVMALYPRVSFVELLAADGGPREAPGFPASKLKATVELEWAVGRYKEVESVRELGTAALEIYARALEEGAYPAELATPAASAYNGEKLALRIESTGEVSIEVPEGPEVWKTYNPTRPERQRPLFAWRLPAL